MPTTKPAGGSNLRSVPPAGTKTHKPTCGCIQCKARRYDELVVRVTEMEGYVEMLEGRLLSRAAELGRAKDGAELLQRTLEESRKITQEREAQLAKKASESAQWSRKAEALAQEKLSLADALADEKRTHRGLQLAVGEIREYLRVPEDDTLLEAVEDLYSRCRSWARKAERTGEANTKLQTELKAAKDLQDLTADKLAATTKMLGDLQAEVAGVEERMHRAEAANTEMYDTLQEERQASRGGILITLTVATILSAVAFFLIGRFGR